MKLKLVILFTLVQLASANYQMSMTFTASKDMKIIVTPFHFEAPAVAHNLTAYIPTVYFFALGNHTSAPYLIDFEIGNRTAEPDYITGGAIATRREGINFKPFDAEVHVDFTFECMASFCGEKCRETCKDERFHHHDKKGCFMFIIFFMALIVVRMVHRRCKSGKVKNVELQSMPYYEIEIGGHIIYCPDASDVDSELL